MMSASSSGSDESSESGISQEFMTMSFTSKEIVNPSQITQVANIVF